MSSGTGNPVAFCIRNGGIGNGRLGSVSQTTTLSGGNRLPSSILLNTALVSVTHKARVSTSETNFTTPMAYIITVTNCPLATSELPCVHLLTDEL